MNNLLNIYFYYLLQDFCLDLFEPSGHGKKKKRSIEESTNEIFPKIDHLIKEYNDSTPYTKFKENIEYTVMMSDGKLHINFIFYLPILN